MKRQPSPSPALPVLSAQSGLWPQAAIKGTDWQTLVLGGVDVGLVKPSQRKTRENPRVTLRRARPAGASFV